MASQTKPPSLAIPSSSPAANSLMAYQAQDSRMTLRQGLGEYFGRLPGLMEQGELPEDLGIGLRAHDVAHVVFGCDTTLVGEVVLARWSLFGITGSLRPYLIGIKRRETRGLFRDAFRSFRIADAWRMMRCAVLAIVRSLRMHERWPFEGYKPYLDQPLCEIRERFGIRVIQAN